MIDILGSDVSIIRPVVVDDDRLWQPWELLCRDGLEFDPNLVKQAFPEQGNGEPL